MVGIEVVASLYDAYNVVKTLRDPCVSDLEKSSVTGLAMVGMVAPGGGYSMGGKAARLIPSSADDVAFGPVPRQAHDVLKLADSKKGLPKGQRGGGGWRNDGSQGAAYSPRTTTYQEWDLDGAEYKHKHRRRSDRRIVTGNDGSAYYTDDHYKSFTRFRTPR